MAAKLDCRVFLDSAYLIALGQGNDAHHPQALKLAARLKAEHTHIVTTQAVLLEVGNALAKVRSRRDAVLLIEALQSSPTVQVVPFSAELALNGWKLFRERMDKDWSWTDCISFVVMDEQKLVQALSSDQHFEQAGFTALLRA